MKKLLLCATIIVSQLFAPTIQAKNFVTQEVMLILMAGISAKEPEVAAAVDLLAMLAVPNAPEYKTDTQRTIAYIGLGALTLYNYEAEDEGRTEEDIFKTNLVVFNIILAAELFGLNDNGASAFNDSESDRSKFNLQVTPEGTTRFNWQYRFD